MIPGTTDEGLGVVDEGRLAVEAFRRRIRRLLLGLAAPAFDALQQDRLFAQHVRALEWLDLDLDVAAAAQDVVAQVAGRLRLADRVLQRGDCFGPLGAHRDDDVGGTHGDGRDGGSLEERRRDCARA
jgi:hypothetical protein